ncbi:MAG: hypothetical protein PPFGHCPK_01105 [Spiroplasma endosymbiont of Drosophila atripex]|nr:MAG: hypothetical protein PPFGHCPK_01105 [Spiroplasma endosymbiont of Drosophila atripex]
MILKLWEGVSLEQYNNWFPLTGKLTNIPTKYKSDNPAQNWYKDVNEWFTTFALRAQNDINAYLNFIFNKFPFETLKNKDIKQSLIDMVFIRIEHDCFNRVPIEFNTNATNTLTSGSTFDANADVILGLRNLLPKRVQSLVKFTRLKPYFRTLSSKGINPNDIDLETFYTKFEVDALIEKEQIERMQGDQDNHDLTLAKQIKLYDDVITPQEESYRGPVTNLIVRGYVATDYDDKTETAIIDFPKEIGTLPPGALQPNPVEGDVTHAATADFSAKQQKRINANENNITELTNNKQNKLIAGKNITIDEDTNTISTIGEKWIEVGTPETQATTSFINYDFDIGKYRVTIAPDNLNQTVLLTQYFECTGKPSNNIIYTMVKAGINNTTLANWNITVYDNRIELESVNETIYKNEKLTKLEKLKE